MHTSSRTPRSTPLTAWLVAALLAGACDGQAPADAGEPPRDGGRDAGGLDASPPADGGPALVDAEPGRCATHHDCDQGSFCHRGACRVGDPPVHHCNKPGCPPGQWCVEMDGTRSICPEDPTYACGTACDCGPAHCCLEGRCVRDDGDPWSGTHGATSLCPVGPDVPPADRLPTYCATEPACHAASQAWRLSGRRGSFLAHDPDTGQATAACSGERCFGTACNCGLGESCVETLEQVATGTTCGLFTGGTCVSNAIAESVFAVPAAELLGCCADGCRSGERCDAGWMHRGNRRAYERVVAECPPAGGCTCGDGSCCPEELRSCAADCMPERCSGGVCQPIVCGDGRCDPFEDDRRCPADCPAGCGDGGCGAGESEATCFTDCSEECGDGWCSAAELTDTGSCPADCDGRCADADLYGRVYRVCGDGVCDRTSTCDYQDPESCMSCPEDCGACDWEIVDVFVERPVRGTLRSVWVNAPDEVFVGTEEGYVYRFDGAGWHLASHVVSGQVEVWGPGPSVAFAIGDAGGHRYDGRSWGEIVVPPQIAAVWGAAADHVLAVSRDAVHRYDGHAWTASPLPSTLGFYIDAWGTGPSDVWVADDGSEVLHYDGSTWTEQPTLATERVRSVWASGPGDVYGVGGVFDRVGAPLRASAVHFDGSAWSAISPEGAVALVAVWGAAPNDVFAVTETGDLWRYDGASWTSYPADTPWVPSDLHGSSASDVYGVGVDAAGAAVIHRFDGADWGAVPVTAQDESFRGVWGPSGADLRLVAGDRVYAFDGATFTSTSLAPTAGRTSLLDVWGASGELFAIGVYTLSEPGRPFLRSGIVWHRQGGTWTDTLLEPSNALWGSGPSDVFAVGLRSPAHFDGATWTTIPLSPRPSDVWGSGAGDVVMVANGALMRCASPPCVDAASFTSTAASGSFLAVSGSGPSDVFAVGLDGVIHHFDGASWSEQRRGGVHLVGVAARGPTDAYAVGEEGTILVYEGSSWSPAQADLRRPGIARCPELTAITNAGGELVVVGLADLVARQRR